MLEVLVGIIFFFLLVSIICAAIREGIEAWRKTRAAYLERGIRELLHDPEGDGLAKSVYEHPLIYSLYFASYKPGRRRGRPGILEAGGALPSYIPAGNFASALMDIAARGPDPLVASDPSAPVLSLSSVRENILNLENEPVQRVLLTAVDSAQGNFDRARSEIEAWYDSSMDRVAGWYKRSTQWLIFGIGLVVAIGLNINTLAIAEYLYRNDAARAAIVSRAEAAAADTAFLSRGFAEARQELDALGLPIGWGAARVADDSRPAGLWNSVFNPILGWLITALAATMGAPVWFDLLNKVMVIRSTVKPREKSPEEGSEDRQRKVPDAPERTQPAHDHRPPERATTPRLVAVNEVEPPEPAAVEDGCDVPITKVTRDEDLPPAEGGVA